MPPASPPCPSRAPLVVGVVATLGFACLPIARWVDEFGGVGNLIAYEAIWWTMVGLVLVHVRFVERRPLASLGFRTVRAREFGIAIAAAVVMLVGLGVLFEAVLPLLGLDEQPAVDRLLATPLWWRLVSTVRAAVGEELLFRGYALERIASLGHRPGVAALGTWAVFTVAHVGPWGLGHLLIAGFGGAVLTALYLWRRNLWLNVITHLLVDGIAVLT